MTDQAQEQEAPIHVFVQGPDGEDFFTSDDLIDCWMSAKYGALGKRILVFKPNNQHDLFAIAVDGPTEFRKYTAEFDHGVLKIFGHDGSLHSAYAPGERWGGQGLGLTN